MKSIKKIVIASVICIALGTLAYFAYLFPFYEPETSDFSTSIEKLLSADYLTTLIPLFIIIGLTAAGILLVIILRKTLAKADKKHSRFADVRTGRQRGVAPKQKPVWFMILRWTLMIVFAFIAIWGGLIFGMGVSALSVSVLSCPWNTEEMTASSCYYLSHLNELFELPWQSILIFFASTIGFILLLGRAICGFLMVLIMMASFFKRRSFCMVCPLGTILGFFHKISLFRIKKDTQSCTECGACYEACPMGIKMIYTEREKVNVTSANCIMCGECIRCCPEDKALSMTCAGIKLYSSSRKTIMSGYEPDKTWRDKNDGDKKI